jgi:YVTN family beta-propeller protein
MRYVRTFQVLGLRIAAGCLVTLLLAAPVAAAPYAFVPNRLNDTVSVIDAATNAVVATIMVGRGPCAVAANVPGARVYVLNSMDDTVSVIDAATRTVTATILVGHLGGQRSGIAVNREGTRIYVANTADNTLSVIDASTNALLDAPISVGAAPSGVAVSPSGSQVYVANSGARSLSVVDVTLRQTVGNVTLGAAPAGVTVHPSGNRVYVTTADGLEAVNPSTMTVVAQVPVIGAYGVAVNADGSRVYVTNNDGNALVAIDATTNVPVGAPINLGYPARGLSVTRGGRIVYVANGIGRRVSVVDADALALTATVNNLEGPDAIGNFMADVAPVAASQALSARQNTATAVTLSATDAEQDPLTFAVVNGPAYGTLSGAPPALTYVPATNFGGVDSFTFKANDGAADSNVATVSITVPFDTNTSLTSTANPSAFGQALTLTSRVASAGGTPQGDVQFFDGADALGTVALTDGTAALQTSAVGAGSRSLRAVYVPVGHFATSTSPALAQNVSYRSTSSSLSISPLSVRYSDLVTFTATITPSVAGGPPPANAVAFKIGTQTIATAPLTPAGGGYQATWTGQLLEPWGGAAPTGQLSPGSKTVVAAVVDQNPNVTVSNATRPMSLLKEDARVAYSGPAALTLGANGAVVLTAMVKDITAVAGDAAWDPYAGEISKAQVLFVDRTTNITLASATVVPGADPKVGTASFTWTPSLGSARSKSYVIGFIVTGYYSRNSSADNAPITISKP